MDIRVSTVPCAFGESIVLRMLAKETRRARPEEPRHGGGSPGDVPRLDAREQRHRARQRAHRIGKVHYPLRGTGGGRRRHQEDSSPWRTRWSTRCPASPRSRPTPRSATPSRALSGHPPAGPRRDHDRRDPGSRNGGDRDPLALTGHIVLSTVHTNDAISSFTRLIDMGWSRSWSRRPCAASRPSAWCARRARAARGRLPPRFWPTLRSRALPPSPGGDPVGHSAGVRCLPAHRLPRPMGIYELVPMSDELQDRIVAGAISPI